MLQYADLKINFLNFFFTHKGAIKDFLVILFPKNLCTGYKLPSVRSD